MRTTARGLVTRSMLAIGRKSPLWFDGKSRTMRALFDFDAGLSRVATGLSFGEGPAWDSKRHVLLFSDIAGDCIYELTDAGTAERFRPSNNSNGLTFDSRGDLIACEHGSRSVTRRSLANGSREVLADRFENARLNSPNDVVVGVDGSVWFTDPPYGIRPEEQELPFQGVYRFRQGETLQCVARDFDRPNGLAFSPDGRVLYVADSSGRRHIRVFSVGNDGSLSGGDVWLDMSGAAPGVPDGLKVSEQGLVFTTGPGGVWVVEPSGEVVGRLQIPGTATNCTFGDRDGRGLYVTTSEAVYRIRLLQTAVSHA